MYIDYNKSYSDLKQVILCERDGPVLLFNITTLIMGQYLILIQIVVLVTEYASKKEKQSLKKKILNEIAPLYKFVWN